MEAFLLFVVISVQFKASPDPGVFSQIDRYFAWAFKSHSLASSVVVEDNSSVAIISSLYSSRHYYAETQNDPLAVNGTEENKSFTKTQ